MDWIKTSNGKHQLVPNGESRYTLSVAPKSQGFVADVSGEPVDDGKVFSTIEKAKVAALAAYDDYWADFDD